MTPRKLLRLYRRYNRISSYPKLKLLQAAFDTDLMAEAKRLKPKIKKWDINKVNKYIDPEFKQKTYEKYAAIAKEYSQRVEQVKQQVFDELCSISLASLNIQDQITEDCVQIKSCSTDAYLSQGSGAGFYARNSLVPLQQKIENQQIETRITHETHRLGNKNVSGIYRLEAKIPFEYGWIIGVHPDSQKSLVEIVQDMWNRGINPRVHYPFLEHGFEEKYNISYM